MRHRQKIEQTLGCEIPVKNDFTHALSNDSVILVNLGGQTGSGGVVSRFGSKVLVSHGMTLGWEVCLYQ